MMSHLNVLPSELLDAGGFNDLDAAERSAFELANKRLAGTFVSSNFESEMLEEEAYTVRSLYSNPSPHDLRFNSEATMQNKGAIGLMLHKPSTHVVIKWYEHVCFILISGEGCVKTTRNMRSPICLEKSSSPTTWISRINSTPNP